MALVGVFYGMRALDGGALEDKATDPQSALGILIGSDYRPMNWCPEKTQKIELFDSTGGLQATFEKPEDISSVCEIMMGAFSMDGIEESSFKKTLVAFGAAAEGVVLEQVPGKPVFRVKGMPFSSPMLSKALDRLVAP